MSTAYDPGRDRGTEGVQEQSSSRHGYDEPAAPSPRAARRPSVLHLVVGVVYLGLAGLWALAASGTVGSDDTWLLPGLLVLAGATGLVAALVAGRRSEDL